MHGAPLPEDKESEQDGPAAEPRQGRRRAPAPLGALHEGDHQGAQPADQGDQAGNVDLAWATLLGRRRYIPEIRAGSFHVRAAGERMAINMPIQGTAADIIKLAMIRIQERMDLANEMAGLTENL